MNKLELIDKLRNEGQISKKEAATIVNLFFGKMSKALAEGDRVEIRGLCSFFVKEYKSYQGRYFIKPIYLTNFNFFNKVRLFFRIGLPRILKKI